MDTLSEVNNALNNAFNKLLQREPALVGLFPSKAVDKKFKFEGGARYRFFLVKAGLRPYMYCYSVARNGNGKFLSWTYKPHYEVSESTGRRALVWDIVDTKETKRRNSAKARAYKKYLSHKKRLGIHVSS